MKKITIFLLLGLSLSVYSQGKFGAFTGFNYSYFTDGVAGQVLAEESFGLQLGIVPQHLSIHNKKEPPLKRMLLLYYLNS